MGSEETLAPSCMYPEEELSRKLKEAESINSELILSLESLVYFMNGARDDFGDGLRALSNAEQVLKKVRK